MALVFSRSRTVNPSCLEFPFMLVPNLTSFTWSLTSSSPSKSICVVLFLLSLRQLVHSGWWSVSLWTPLCYFVATMHLFSQSLSIIIRCVGQLLNVTFSIWSSMCIRWPWFAPIRVSCRCVIDVVLLGWVCCTRLIRTRITDCSMSFHLLLREFDIPELSCCRSSYIEVRSIKVHMWFKLPNTADVWHRNIGWVQSTVHCFPESCFFSVFRGAGACGVPKAIYK